MKKQFQIPKYAIELLENGNRATFADMFTQKYPKEPAVKENKNKHYSSWIDWIPDEKTYIVYDKEGKAYFNTKIEFLGFKEW